MAQVLIVHGWSDHSSSFLPLVNFLRKHGFDAVPLWLGDYISLDDDVGVEDVGKRMAAVINGKLKSGELQPGFDLIVHSTGGLVAREWLSATYSDGTTPCPVKRLIMLAPANYGSRLASLGQSMLGRLFKGWNDWFHTGKIMLGQLELASPYQWSLAQRDLFVPEGEKSAPATYGEKGVWPFILVGSHPYTGELRKIINENGSDGTVRVAAANLNARGVTVDFTANEAQPQIILWTPRQTAAFPLAVLPDRTHGSIINPDERDVNSTPGFGDRLGGLILEALNCSDWAGYQALDKKWDVISEETAALAGDTAKRKAVFEQDEEPDFFHQYMQVVVHVVDDHGADVNDYFLEFSGPENDPNDDATVYFHREVLENVHNYGTNGSYRCLFADRTDLMENFYAKIGGAAEKVLHLSVSASPVGKNVSYFEDYEKGAKGTVKVHLQKDDAGNPRWLRRNTTHFLKLVIPRSPRAEVFQLNKAK